MSVFKKVILGMMVLAGALSSQAYAEKQEKIINFDDLRTDYYFSGREYEGFKWNNFKTPLPIASVRPDGYEVSMTSGTQSIINVGGNAASITSANGEAFDFNSAQMLAGLNEGLNVTVEGWLNGELKYKETVVLTTVAPQLVVFDFLDIDTLKFKSFGGTRDKLITSAAGTGYHFMMDDLTFNSTPAVPEPSTYAMMLGGLGILGFMIRKRKLKRS